MARGRKTARPAVVDAPNNVTAMLSTGNKPLMKALQTIRTSGAAGVHADQNRRGHSRRNRRAANAAVRNGRYDD